MSTEQPANLPQMPPSNEGGLNTPTHEEAKPEYLNADVNDTHVNIQAPIKKGIEVVAIQDGFFNNRRRKPGDKFFIKDFSRIGAWMECIDPVLEKKKLQLYKDKKANR